MASMAIPKIKATYSLDPETVRAIERLARRWRVSKSEALRRAIRAAAGSGPTEAKQALAALDRLQRLLSLTPSGARRWLGTARAERRASVVRARARRELSAAQARGHAPGDAPGDVVAYCLFPGSQRPVEQTRAPG